MPNIDVPVVGAAMITTGVASQRPGRGEARRPD
jgi:hypothetical protein